MAGFLKVREFPFQKNLINQYFIIEKFSLNKATFREILLGGFFYEKMLVKLWKKSLKCRNPEWFD